MPVGVDDVRRGAAGRAPRSSRRCARSSTTRATRPARATRAASRRRLPSNEAAVEVILRAIERAGYRPGEDVAIALDPATSSILVEPGPASRASPTRYVLAREGRTLDSGELIDLWARLGRALPDRLARGRPGRGRLGRLARARPRGSARTIQLVGDDLLVTNTERASPAAIDEDATNSVLIKLNQIGTLTETIEAIELARGAGWTAMVSPSLRRDRGHDDRRPRRRDGDRPDQDRRAVALRAGRQVQPAAADRGRARRQRPLSRAGARCRASGRRRAARPEARVESPLVSRLVDRGAITAAYVGIGMAVTIVVSFMLFIPIEWVIWLLALPSGLLIGYYANQRSDRRAGPWRRILVNGLFAGVVTGLTAAVLLLADQGAVLLRRRRLSATSTGSTGGPRSRRTADRRRLRLPALPGGRPRPGPRGGRRDRRRRRSRGFYWSEQFGTRRRRSWS